MRTEMDIRKSVLWLIMHVCLPYLIAGQKVPGGYSYLDLAMEIIENAEGTNNIRPKVHFDSVDCYEVLKNGYNVSGVYTVFPKNRILDGKAVEVFCDMDTDGGGWTVIQRRGNFMRGQEYFFQDWNPYKEGFGDIEKDFWLGNDNIFALSNQNLYSIRFDLKDAEGNKRYALYDTFWIDDEDHKYTIHIQGYSGDAGDSMIVDHNNRSFSTKDQDNDNQSDQSCAQIFKGGWWYGPCKIGLASNLNAVYQPGKHATFADGMIWYYWKGHYESMEFTEIKIRPKAYRTANWTKIHLKRKQFGSKCEKIASGYKNLHQFLSANFNLFRKNVIRFG